MGFDHLKYARSGHPDLTHRQMAMLILVVRNGNGTVRGLAAELAAPKSAITRATNTLMYHQFVTRVQDKADARSVNILPTKRAVKFLAEVM